MSPIKISQLPVVPISLAVSLFLSACSLLTNHDSIDWSATGSMLGGIGAIGAALGTIFIILLTWRYVTINAKLLELNRDSLQAMKESVQASRDMAEVMRHQLAIATADVVARIEQEHEPFRHLLQRMIAGVEQVKATDLIAAFHGTNLGLRPDSSWFLPSDYREKVEAAKNLDGGLHRQISGVNEPPDGVLYRVQIAIGQLRHVLRPEYANVPREAYNAAENVKQLALEATKGLEQILAYVNDRSERLRAVAQPKSTSVS